MGLRGESTDLEGKERQVVSEAERKLRMLGSPVIEEMSSQNNQMLHRDRFHGQAL